jgi:hypothetical protein
MEDGLILVSRISRPSGPGRHERTITVSFEPAGSAVTGSDDPHSHVYCETCRLPRGPVSNPPKMRQSAFPAPAPAPAALPVHRCPPASRLSQSSTVSMEHAPPNSRPLPTGNARALVPAITQFEERLELPKSDDSQSEDSQTEESQLLASPPRKVNPSSSISSAPETQKARLQEHSSGRPERPAYADSDSSDADPPLQNDMLKPASRNAAAKREPLRAKPPAPNRSIRPARSESPTDDDVAQRSSDSPDRLTSKPRRQTNLPRPSRLPSRAARQEPFDGSDRFRSHPPRSQNSDGQARVLSETARERKPRKAKQDSVRRGEFVQPLDRRTRDVVDRSPERTKPPRRIPVVNDDLPIFQGSEMETQRRQAVRLGALNEDEPPARRTQGDFAELSPIRRRGRDDDDWPRPSDLSANSRSRSLRQSIAEPYGGGEDLDDFLRLEQDKRKEDNCWMFIPSGPDDRDDDSDL